MPKRLKKELQVMIEEKLGQLFFGDKKKDLRLLMLRPIDLIEFSEFAGTNADDILVWVGKTLGKSYMEKFFYNKDWSTETIASVVDSLASEEKDNIMAKNLCLLYQGLFSGMFESLQVDVDVEEIKCVLLGDEKCVYKFDFIGEELEKDLVDEDSEETVSEFLSTL